MSIGKKKDKRVGIAVSIVAFCIVEAAVLFTGCYFYQTISSSMTANVIQDRETLTNLSASAISIKLDQLTALAKLFANEPGVVQAVSSGDWQGATGRVENLLATNPEYYDSYVDRFVILGSDASIKGVFPQLSGDIFGKTDDAAQEWMPVLADRQNDVYLTNVYVRSAAPHISEVEIVAPIPQDSTSKPLGYFELQIPTNSFSDFGKDIDLTGDGYAYFVDRNGVIVSSPKFSSSQIVNLSNTPLVKDLFANQSGSGIYYSSITKTQIVAAYRVIPGYGWGVIARESTAFAFEARDGILNRIASMMAILSVVNGVAFWLFAARPYNKNA